MKPTLNHIITALASFWLYFGLLATPEKIIIATLAFMTVCVFCFSVWAYFQTNKSNKQTKKLVELFEKRFLLTEERTNLLVDSHLKRNPDDTKDFLELERKMLHNNIISTQNDFILQGSSSSKRTEPSRSK